MRRAEIILSVAALIVHIVVLVVMCKRNRNKPSVLTIVEGTIKNQTKQLHQKAFERYGNEGMGGQLVVDLSDALEIVRNGRKE